jgi:bacterioferritin (cytochrome b1)
MIAFISTGSSKGSTAAGTSLEVQAVHEARKVTAHAGELQRSVVCFDGRDNYRDMGYVIIGNAYREGNAHAALAESLAAFVA